MSIPHQRIISGKLRNTPKSAIQSNNVTTKQKTEVYVGVENATSIEQHGPEEDLLCYLQTPDYLTDVQVSVLSDIVKAWKGNPEIDISRIWRRTWNIGTWNIGGRVSLCINMMQPNIANCWVNITNCTPNTEQRAIQMAQEYSSLNLEKSVCKITQGNRQIQIQGRWSLIVANRLLNESMIKEEDIVMASLNITQSRLFAWLIVENEAGRSIYQCLFTRQSAELICRYLPDWCADIEEASAAHNISIRLKNPEIRNDASQLQINNSGYIQYNGRREGLGKLYESIYIAIHATVNSIYRKSLIDSFEFKIHSRETNK